MDDQLKPLSQIMAESLSSDIKYIEKCIQKVMKGMSHKDDAELHDGLLWDLKQGGAEDVKRAGETWNRAETGARDHLGNAARKDKKLKNLLTKYWGVKWTF